MSESREFQLQTEIEALRLDALRYRWIRAHLGDALPHPQHTETNRITLEIIDGICDSALRRSDPMPIAGYPTPDKAA